MLERELFALFDNAGPAFILDDGGAICFWNRAATVLLGYARAEVLGRRGYDLLDATGALGTRICTEDCCLRERADNSETIPSFDLCVKTRAGERLWINATTLGWRHPCSGRAYLIHLFHDVSERKRNEELLAQVKAVAAHIVALAGGVAQPAPVGTLTAHERDLLRLFARGQSSAEVASQLRITAQTVRNHVHRINQKLRTHNRLEAVAHAKLRRLI